eukprot:Blabericola_migrator_1__6715@NODE_3399_length_1808_cov_6_357266_g1569_i3_p2_GENE_NODE_3399_length_1808_cov_6_357266_g1569_i3NODE_3399_length_1808_cov_6_357266_g1569_i3_p2_ORF_typecomplete_len101_score16_22PriA_CRR/PF18319_1/0_29_NODE_3399_length_1808_cov_6_357266_g1569_i312881590
MNASINWIIELHDCGEENKALPVMGKEFVDAEESQARFFGLLGKAIRNYASVPELSEDSNAFYPHDSNTSLEECLICNESRTQHYSPYRFSRRLLQCHWC